MTTPPRVGFRKKQALTENPASFAHAGKTGIEYFLFPRDRLLQGLFVTAKARCSNPLRAFPYAISFLDALIGLCVTD
jgi:hypothetical protein